MFGSDSHQSFACGQIGAVSREARVGDQRLGEAFPPLGCREGSPATMDGPAGEGVVQERIPGEAFD